MYALYITTIYHEREACVSPYMVVFNFHTLSGLSSASLGGLPINGMTLQKG